MAIDWKAALSTRPMTVGELLLTTIIQESLPEGYSSEVLETMLELLVSRADGRLSRKQLLDADPDDLAIGIGVLRETMESAMALAKLAKQFEQKADS